MKLLLLGGTGQVGQEIIKRVQSNDYSKSVRELVAPARLDVQLADKNAIAEYLSSVKPDVIINCAAYTAVDKAETDQDACHAVNALVPQYIAESIANTKTFLIQVSTDYVFAGNGTTPLTEKDETKPINVYGATKLAGETAITNILGLERAAIIRTASVHGKFGQNFVHTMLKLFSEKEFVSVVSDQWMSPTWAGFLADALLTVAYQQKGGLYHCAARDAASWFEFAEEIERLTADSRTNTCEVRKTTADTFKRPAARPTYSVLNTDTFEKTFSLTVPTWRQGLVAHLGEIA